MTREELEVQLLQLDAEQQEIAEGMWLLKGQEGSADVVVLYSPPVVLLRLKVLDLPRERDDARLARLYRHLLELNANDVVHGSYGIEENDVILSDALELETLDFHELQSSYESMQLAAGTHLSRLAELVPVAHEG